MNNQIINITGVSGSRTAPVISDITAEENKRLLVITPGHNDAEILAKDISAFVDVPVFVLPDEGDDNLIYDSRDLSQSFEKRKVLTRMMNEESFVAVAGVKDALRKLPPIDFITGNRIEIKKGSTIDPEDVREKLYETGYDRFPMVEGKGQYAARGDILDIFAPDFENPVRIELFGDEVDSIRTFDIDTQKSLAKLDSVTIYPAGNFLRNKKVLDKAADKAESRYNREIRKADGERRDKLEEKEAWLTESLRTMTNLRSVEETRGPGIFF